MRKLIEGRLTVKENWIVPCNTKYFDVIAHFKNSPIVVWRNSFSMCVGDIVYIYLSAPYAEIKFKCRVVSELVDDETLLKNSYAIIEKKPNIYFSKKDKYVQMELVITYPEGTFTYSKLKEQGLGQVQIQARTDRNLQRYLDMVENNLFKMYNGGDVSGN